VARLYYTAELLLVAGSKSDAIEASAPEENDKDDREEAIKTPARLQERTYRAP
jgi:hypothetical protein